MATKTTGLSKTQVSISLTGGIDRKTDPKQLADGQMYTADNVQYVTEKQCRKRFGYNTLTPPGGLQGAPFAAIGCRDNVEPVILGSGALNRYNTQTQLSTYIPANTQGYVASTPITSSSGSGTQPSPPIDASIATDGNSYLFICWQEANGSTYQTNSYVNVYYGVQDLQTGAWIISPRTLQNIDVTPGGKYLVDTTAPKALYYNGSFYMGLGEVTTSSSKYYYSIELYQMDLANLQFGLYQSGILPAIGYIENGTSIAITKGSYPGWDMGVWQDSLITVTQGTGSTGAGIITKVSLITGALVSNTFNFPNGPSGISWRIQLDTNGPTASPFIATSPTGMVRFSSALVATSSGGFGSPLTQPINPVNVIWYQGIAYAFAEAGASSGTTITWINSAGSSGLIPSPSTSQQAGLASRCWIYNSRIYFWQFVAAYAGSGIYRAYVLTEFNPSTLGTAFVARVGYQDSWIANFGTMQNPCEVVQIPGTNKYVTALTLTTDAYGGVPATTTSNPTYTSTYYGNLTRTEFDFTPSSRIQMYSMPTGGLFVAGAFPLQYDGQSVSEAGFTVSPDFISSPGAVQTFPIVSTTGGSIAAGTYSWYACFVRRDAYGNVIRSSPSPAYLLVLTGNTNKVTFPAITYTGTVNVYIEYYRTTIASPSEPYFIGKCPIGAAFTDTFADTALVTNFNLYTYSGEYPNDPPPAVHSAAFGETRAYIIPSDARNSIWCSKQYSPGRTVEWTSNLVLSEGGTHNGQFTAIAVLDTNVIVFKQDQILYFNGDGPDNAGATGGFSSFQKLTSDVGCIDPGSLAIIPGGLLFRSQRGIELLSRGLQVQYIGGPIEPIIQEIKTISSTCVLPQYQQVRFVSNAVGDPVLVFDYMGNRWSTYSNMSALTCANVQGTYWWVSQDGTTVNVEDPTAFTDNGNAITMTLETPEIPMVGTQGWGRLYRLGVLGEYKSPHILAISFAYDHAETYTDTIIYGAVDPTQVVYLPSDVTLQTNGSNIATDIVTAPCPEQFRISRVPRQVMQTVRIRLQDTPFAGYYITTGEGAGVSIPVYGPAGESCAISNITLEVGQKAILAKLPGSKTV